MAEAYLALAGELPRLRTLVVVKRILPHLSENEQFVRMFIDEARIGALLDHPNIPRIIEVGHDEDGYFLAMEAVPGKPLSAILRRALRRERPLGQEYAAFIVGRAAAALAYAHALTDGSGRPLNIVHRDVSPENIMVSFEGAVKMIDFGIASAQGRVSQTVVGGLKGKIEYMSPEQATGAPVDRRSDVFSLGIVLWEALSGRRLFRRETELGVMRAITDEPIPRPSGPHPIPHRLERIVMTALEREPDDRFQDAHEMALLLERYAFRSDGFDPAELVAQIKQLFPADYSGWRATVGLAQANESSGPREVTATFHLLGGMHTRGGQPTLALKKKERAEEPTRAEVPARLQETPALELDSGDASVLPSLSSWGAGEPDPESDSGESAASLGNDVAAYAALHAWVSRRARMPRRFAWLLAGLVLGIVSAVVLVPGVRSMSRVVGAPPAMSEAPSTVAPPPPPPPLIEPAPPTDPTAIVAPAMTHDEPGSTASAPPEPSPIEPPEPPMALAPASPAPRAGVTARPAISRPSPAAPGRVGSVSRARPIARRALPPPKPAAPSSPPSGSSRSSESAPAARPLVRPGWRDPFNE
jgi:serine/threonine-protein kinase